MESLMSDHRYKVAVLLPTRGRTGALESSLMSLIDNAHDLSGVQLMLGFDKDDSEGKTHFMNQVRPQLVERGVAYQALVFEPLGYTRLNEYVNRLAGKSDADWLFFWNDDAVMQSRDWDRVIASYTGQFKLLAVHTHNEHPYSIFPIAPRAWFDVMGGYLSPHQISDAWLSQQAYMLDILERIDVHVLHDRHDLTGNNNDPTFKNRVMYEGNPNDPHDFHHRTWLIRRMNDTDRLAAHMRTQGINTDWWDRVKTGEQDPWDRLRENDINKQMVQFKVRL